MAVSDYKQVCYKVGSLVTESPAKAVEGFLRKSAEEEEKVYIDLVFILRRRQNVESWLAQFKKAVASGWEKVNGRKQFVDAAEFCDSLAVLEQREASDEEREWYEDCFGEVSMSNRDQFVCLRLT